MSTPRIPVLAVVGVGLIGGSFAAALRRAGQVGRVLGVGRDPKSLERARELGLIDEAVSPAEAAQRADLAMLAAPVGSLGGLLAQMRAHLKPGIVLTDAGSTKAEVAQAARQALGERIGCFVPGHPIAGAERTGPGAADADLYRDRNVVLCPLPENTPQAVELVRLAWQDCGARLFEMDAELHDRLSRLIAELLDVARIDTGRLQLYPRPSDAATLVGRVVDSVQASTSRVLELSVAPGLPEIFADPDKFTQVVTNLVENGVRHGEGVVRVSLEGYDEGVRLLVDDEGDGIPEDLRKRVFTKFWKGGARGGSGLGLYLVGGLTRAHGGTVTIAQAPGGGARIVTEWPSEDRRPA